jgi:excisionase family DNA binding protein
MGETSWRILRSEQAKYLAPASHVKRGKYRRTVLMPKHGENKPSAETVNSAILTKKEAAEHVGCSCRYLERAIVAGRLRALKPTGKLVRIRRSDLDAFLESGATIGGVV